MWAYIVRRILWTVPIVLGIVLITFVLFRYVARDPALLYAGKIHSAQQLEAIRHKMGLDKPRWINTADARGDWKAGRTWQGVGALFNSQFFDILLFRFHNSVRYDESVWRIYARAAPISLAIQLPAFIIVLGLQLVLALLVASNRGRLPDYAVTFLAVLGMSVPALSIYMAAQWLFGGYLKWFPVAGWNVWPYWIPFTALPIIVTVVGGIGGGTRFYRTVALEEINSDYVRTARAKGVPRREILLTHIMRNMMIPVLTNTVTALPGLVIGSLLLERMFQIPGMGGTLVEGIFNNDEPIIISIVYLTSIAYCVMLLLNDVLYALVDPRVSLH